jgi:uncharacterized protein
MHPALRLLRVVFICLLAELSFMCDAGAEPAFPALTGRVVDQAQILDAAARSRIDGKLEQLESKTGNQLVVVTLRSLQGYDIADYGYRLGRSWGIGQKGKNNGAILLVAPNERRVRIEVGYGLEGTITDAVSRLIIENAILPRFRANDFPGGIERGVDDLVLLLSGNAEDFKRRAAEQQARPSGTSGTASFAFVVLLFVIWFVIFVRRSQRSGYAGRQVPPIWFPTGGSRYRGGWPGGGGWSSGGSSGSGGGFSGGGGSFGGGGASGSW